MPVTNTFLHQTNQRLILMTKLIQMMRQKSPDGGLLLAERKTHMEVMDEATGNVWMTVNSVTEQEFDDFELAENWRKVGRASGAMDQALFLHSPNADGQPVREQIINGLRFVHVAQPLPPSQSSSGLVEVMVNKAHILGFDVGRQLSVLRFDDKHYVEVVGSNQNDGELDLAKGANIEKITLSKPWVVELPNPTQTLWAFKPALRSFQGPVNLPQVN